MLSIDGLLSPRVSLSMALPEGSLKPSMLDTMIDFGFVIGAFVPLVLLWMWVTAILVYIYIYLILSPSFGENHLDAVWRGSLGYIASHTTPDCQLIKNCSLGMVPALAVLIWRIKMEEPSRYKRDSMKNAKIPYWLIFKRYWVRLAAISFTW